MLTFYTRCLMRFCFAVHIGCGDASKIANKYNA